ncbi:MAG: cyclic nucleotide-binding domain-containing protein, partial [Gemmatimonadetes bacterium]|nr:cyclic nucleotide-binding domain-containing protein [Gemmatimonadota bacterium]
DDDARVRGRALVFLCRASPGEQARRTDEWLESREPALVEAALVCRIEQGDEEAAGSAARILGRLVRGSGEEAAPLRAACARALGRVAGLHPLQRHLETLLSDGHPGVVADALRAATATPRIDLLPSILPHLEDGETRPLARRALAAFGEGGVAHLSASLRDPELPIEVRRWIPGAFLEIGTPAAYRALVEGLPTLSTGRHRLYALKALNKLRRRRPDWAVPVETVRDELQRELAMAYDLERQIAVVESARRSGEAPDRTATPYEQALRYAATSTVERAFRLQGLLYPPQTMYFAYAGLAEGDTTYSAHALELLEISLERGDAARLIPLIDPDFSPAGRAEQGSRWYDLEGGDLAEDLERLFEGGEPWLQAYGVALAADTYRERLGPELERLSAGGPPLVRPLARRATRSEEEGDMALTSVEKAAALRNAELLGELGADDLLQLAAVAEEREFDKGETLFYEGEEGDYLYVLLDGRIRVEREDREVFVAVPGDTIGTFSILDRRPRSAGAVALASTRTLAIHRADMGQILADNYPLVERIFDYLTGIIREMNERVYSRGGRDDDVG